MLPGGINEGVEEAGEDAREQVRLRAGDVLGAEVGDGGDPVLEQLLRDLRW